MSKITKKKRRKNQNEPTLQNSKQNPKLSVIPKPFLPQSLFSPRFRLSMSASRNVPENPLPLDPADEKLEVGELVISNVYRGSFTRLDLPEEVTIFRFTSKNKAKVFVEQLQKAKECPFFV